MEELRLPPELQDLDRFLARGPRPEPSAALRRRVLSRMRSELDVGYVFSKWRFAAAFAATVLASLSLSLGVLHAGSLVLQPGGAPPSIDEVASRLQQLAPDLPREDSRVQAKLRHICVEVTREMPLGEILSDQDSHDS
jgi:hypothetical protein